MYFRRIRRLEETFTHYLQYGVNEGLTAPLVPADEQIHVAAFSSGLALDQTAVNLVGVMVSLEPVW